MNHLRTLCIVVLIWMIPVAARGCPFCPGSLELTFSQQIEDGVTAVIARQAGGRGEQKQTDFIILDVLKLSYDYPLSAGEEIRTTAYSEGVTGELYFIAAGLTEDGQALWGPPQPITTECRQYILQRPDYSRPRSERLAFYANYLEDADTDVAIDAWTEFASASFEDIRPIVDRLPHERLSSVVAGVRDNTAVLQSPEWLGLYGMLLGLCGDESDAKVLQDMVLAPPLSPEMPRLGIDGVMGGLLLLKGEAGLDLLNEHVVNNPSAPVSEHVAVRNACTFMWSYGDNRVGQARLEETVRRYLHDPQLASYVLPDLARWGDWESIDVIAEIHGDAAFADPDTQQKIIQFLLAAERAAAVDATKPLTTEMIKCQQLLEIYRADQPTLVQGAAASVIR